MALRTARIRCFVALVGVSAALTCWPAAAGASWSVSFATEELAAPGAMPHQVAVADVTGDGRKDLLFTTYYDGDAASVNSLWLAAQQADGTLTAPVRVAQMPVASAMDLAVGDLDNDGRADVAVAAFDGVEAFYQRNGGLDGPYIVPGSLGTNAGSDTPPGSVLIADMTHDGKNDVVVNSSDRILVLAGKGGTSGFTAWKAVQELVADPPAAAADVNGDQQVDLVGDAGYVRVWSPKSNGRDPWDAFDVIDLGTTGGPFGAGYRFTGDVTTGDVNGDGLADVLATQDLNAPDALLEIYLQTKNGIATSPVTYPAADVPERLAAADMNGDGRLDVVTTEVAAVALGVLLGNGDGTFGAETLTAAPFVQHPPNIAVGDLNSDGKPDVVIPDPTKDPDDGIIVMRQTGA